MDLRLKVSEQQYLRTIEDLKTEEGKLSGAIDKMIALQDKVSRAYKGLTANVALNAIKDQEEKTRHTLESVQKQRIAIEKHLQSLNTTDADIRKQYQEAQEKIKHSFD